MPREKRSNTPAAIHHVTLRAVADLWPFQSVDLRRWFLARLTQLTREEDFRVLVYALMDNHVHLLLLMLTAPLSHVMSRLATGFATHYNLRFDRKGHVFGRRYWNGEATTFVSERRNIRYILRNPIKHGMLGSVAELQQSDRTSLPALMGHAEPIMEDVATVLGCFGERVVDARSELLTFIELGDEGFDPYNDDETSSDRTRSADEARARMALRRQAERRNLLRADGWDLEKLEEFVCTSLGVPREELRSSLRPREISAARAVISFLALNDLGVSLKTTARFLDLGSSSVLAAAQRGRQIAADHDLAIRLSTGVENTPVVPPTP